jgi:hypothetical protein
VTSGNGGCRDVGPKYSENLIDWGLDFNFNFDRKIKIEIKNKNLNLKNNKNNFSEYLGKNKLLSF